MQVVQICTVYINFVCHICHISPHIMLYLPTEWVFSIGLGTLCSKIELLCNAPMLQESCYYASNYALIVLM